MRELVEYGVYAVVGVALIALGYVVVWCGIGHDCCPHEESA